MQQPPRLPPLRSDDEDVDDDDDVDDDKDDDKDDNDWSSQETLGS